MAEDPEATQVMTTSGHRIPVDLPRAELPPRAIIVTCAGCQGHGRVQMPVHDILTESVALIADNPDPVIVKFYERLFEMDPNLVAIFPPDLVTAPAHADGSKGAHQRDMLVNALVAVATLYGAGAAEEVKLNTQLRQWGRTHAVIQWPDGRVGPPLPHHWAVVARALFDTLHAVAGDRWRPEYDAAWAAAYDHAEVEMRHAINHEGREMTVPRMPRETADEFGGQRYGGPR